jgi:hypothetical protein
MRLAIIALLGLVAGVTASHLMTGCGPCPVAPLSAGTYYGMNNTTEADYKLVVSPDFISVVETFTRNGASWEIDYVGSGTPQSQ